MPRATRVLWCLPILVAACQLPGKVPQPVTSSAARVVEREIPASTVHSLSIRSGNGSLEVAGVQGASSLKVNAHIYTQAGSLAEAERISNEIKVHFDAESTENPGLVVDNPHLANAGERFRADLKIQVPEGVHIVIHDGDGDITVRGLAGGLEIDNEAGGVDVENVRGGVRITNHGGPCKVISAAGRIVVNDGPGELTVSQITGEIEVNGGGGPLAIRNVTGNITVMDNPADVEISNIDGNATLIGVSTTSSKISGVSGAVIYPAPSKTGSQRTKP